MAVLRVTDTIASFFYDENMVLLCSRSCRAHDLLPSFPSDGV